MSGDDFSSSIPKRIPDKEYAKFKNWLLEKAREEQSEHLFTSRYADVGLSLAYLLEVYEAGKERKIPEAWMFLYKQMKQEESSEYETYLRLHAKYAEEHRVFDITIERSFHAPVVDEVDEEAGQSRVPKKRRTVRASREIKKDGDIHSFN
jgi:galactose-1-phosphate uridylyltransferase